MKRKLVSWAKSLSFDEWLCIIFVPLLGGFYAGFLSAVFFISGLTRDGYVLVTSGAIVALVAYTVLLVLIVKDILSYHANG